MLAWIMQLWVRVERSRRSRSILVADRAADLLPVPYFHVVFTLPAAIANIAYAVSQRIRKRIEEAFGWIKTIAGQDKTSFRGRDRVGWAFIFAAAATI